MSLFEQKLHSLKSEKCKLEKRMESYRASLNYDASVDIHEYKHLYCSQIVADVYKRIGVLPKGRLSHLYLPADFSSNVYTKGMFLEKHYQFSPEIIVHKKRECVCIRFNLLVD